MNVKDYENSHSEKLNVARAMGIYGGGFVKALAECIRRADRTNLLKIKNTWPEYWQEYLEHSKRLKSKKEE